MAEYTPTTEQMREDWGDLVVPVVAPPKSARAERLAEFDRWLAARDREVAAKALRDAADRFMPHPALGLARLADAAADLLRAEADRIEKGAGDEPR